MWICTRVKCVWHTCKAVREVYMLFDDDDNNNDNNTNNNNNNNNSHHCLSPIVSLLTRYLWRSTSEWNGWKEGERLMTGHTIPKKPSGGSMLVKRWSTPLKYSEHHLLFQGSNFEHTPLGWFQTFFIFTPTWGNDPFWRACFFKWVGSTTNWTTRNSLASARGSDESGGHLAGSQIGGHTPIFPGMKRVIDTTWTPQQKISQKTSILGMVPKKWSYSSGKKHVFFLVFGRLFCESELSNSKERFSKLWCVGGRLKIYHQKWVIFFMAQKCVDWWFKTQVISYQ